MVETQSRSYKKDLAAPIGVKSTIARHYLEDVARSFFGITSFVHFFFFAVSLY